METHALTGMYESVAQRVAVSHLRSLAALPEGAAQQGAFEAQRDLHSLFRAMYAGMAGQPDLFGLPVQPDFYVDDEDREKSIDKQEANRRLARPRAQLDLGLAFLMEAGLNGRLDGQRLLLTPTQFAAALQKPKPGRAFLRGLAGVGLVVDEGPEQAALRCPRYPAAPAGLQALAQACAAVTPANLGRFLFARCDFGALRPGYRPAVLDMYAVFGPEMQARLAHLHDFFTARGYQAALEIAGVFAWNVKYQGSRKIKSSPLFQVEYQDRMHNPLMVQIKCASANRITPVITQHSQALQDDFFARRNKCNKPHCNWCDNKKGMGPSVLHHNGGEYTICWYVNSHVKELNDETVALIKEYAGLHEHLAPLN